MTEQPTVASNSVCITTDSKEQCWFDPSSIGGEIAFFGERMCSMSLGLPREMVDLHIEDGKEWRGAWKEFIKDFITNKPFMCSSQHLVPRDRRARFWYGDPIYISDQFKLSEYSLENCGGVSSWDRFYYIEYGTRRVDEMSIEEYMKQNSYYWATYFREFSIKSILEGLIHRVMSSDRVVRKGKDNKIYECEGFASVPYHGSAYRGISLAIKKINIAERCRYDDGNRYWDVYNYLHDEIRIPEVLCTMIANYDDFMLIVTI